VRPIEQHEIGRAADVLADAFLDDPFAVWLFRERRRRKRLAKSWAIQLRVVSLPRGYAFTTAGLEGVALWAPPGEDHMTFVQQLRLLAPFIRILGPMRLPMAAAGYGVITRARPPEPHWYLSTIGIAPAHQRKGFGTTLLRPMLERADVGSELVYLETFRPENVPYYERFGFRVVGEADIREGPHMWSMSREPVAGSR
jgi:ribosomal protein S18 acetylase RimI-like enzyme